MATFVLVHPAWFGGWCWKKLVPSLRAAGHDVHTPTLTGLGERAHLTGPNVDLQTHVDDVVNRLTCEDVESAVLVGSSSGGMVITGVANEVPQRIAHVVYLDAFVPKDHQCLFELVPPERRPAMKNLVEQEGDGWQLPRFAPPPWEQFLPQAWQVHDADDLAWALARLRPTPFGHFTRAVRRDNPDAERLPRTYIRCTRWPNPAFDRYVEHAARTPGWRHLRRDWPHLPYLTNADDLAADLLTLVAD